MEPPNHAEQSPKVGYLFGHPISHSLSPLVHSTIFTHLSLPYTYTLHESHSIPSFLSFTTSPDFYGASITMPHKVSIIPHLDALTPAGTAIGAINTLYTTTDPSSGRRLLAGTNTDCHGIHLALSAHMTAAQQQAAETAPALIIGGGGTARAAVYALKKLLGVGTVYMLNRDAGEVEVVVRGCRANGFGEGIVQVRDVRHARALDAPRVIVSAIPDFEPLTEGERLVRECLALFLERGREAREGGEERGVMLEMCYHPRPETAIAKLGEGMGWDVVYGTEAMVFQALEQDHIWTGRDVRDMPVEKVKAALREALDNSRAHM